MSTKKPLSPEQKAAKNQKARDARAAKAKGRTAEPQQAATAPTESFTACQLYYRIPSKAKFPNPSGKLRRCGFRVDGSVWVIPEHALPYTLIHDLREKAGADVGVVKFDPSEAPRLVKMAVQTLRKDVEAQLARVETALESTAGVYLHDSEIPGERDTMQAGYEAQVKDVFSRLETLMDDVQVAVRNFGVDPKRLQLGDIRTAYEGLQVGAATRAAAYAAATQALRNVQTRDATALAKGAARDEVPAYAVSDALRDAGRDADADALDAAFAPGTASHEYSLIDGDAK
jgi:hypothetical protein